MKPDYSWEAWGKKLEKKGIYPKTKKEEVVKKMKRVGIPQRDLKSDLARFMKKHEKSELKDVK